MKDFTADELRSLASTLDDLTQTTRRTGVVVHGYDDEHLTVGDHVVRLCWEPPLGETDGSYTVDFSD